MTMMKVRTHAAALRTAPLSGIRRRRTLVGVLRNAGWLWCERLVRLVSTFAVTAFVSRYLGPADFGTLSYAVAIVVVTAELANLGLGGGAFVRQLIERRERQGVLLGTALRLRTYGGLAAVGASLLAVVALNGPDRDLLVLVLLVSSRAVFRGSEIIALLYQAEGRMKSVALSGSAGIVASGLASLALVALEAPLWSFGLALALEPAVFAAAIRFGPLRSMVRAMEWRFSAPEARDLLRRTWPLVLSALALAANLKIDQVMLEAMAPRAEVGVYAAAARISELWYFVPVALSNAVFPALVRTRQRDERGYRRQLQFLLDGNFALAVTLVIGTLLTADVVIAVVYGHQFAAAAAIVRIHIFGALFMFVRTAISKWLVMADLLVFSLVTHGLGAAVNIGLNLVLIPAHGARGAAIATVLSYATSSYLALYCNRKTWPVLGMVNRSFLLPLRVVQAAASYHKTSRWAWDA